MQTSRDSSWIVALLGGTLVGALLTVGCGKSTNAPPKVVPDPLIGLTSAQVKAQLGPPHSESTADGRPKFGVFPDNLLPEETATLLYYPDVSGEQLHIFVVTPEIYRREMGTDPGDEAGYVLKVYRFPKGTVF